MGMLVSIAYLVVSWVVSALLYWWFAGFKQLSSYSMTRLNKESPNKKVKMDKESTKVLNDFSFTVFIVIGFFVWSLQSVTIGRIAYSISDHYILKWIVYVVAFFVFLRFPFKKTHQIILFYYDIKKFPEQLLFTFVTIVFYLLSLFCYEDLPKIFKWHLYYLN